MISAEAVKRLKEYPEFKQLVVHITHETAKLNVLDDEFLEGLKDAIQISVEVKARKRAYDALVRILGPFIEVTRERTTSGGNKEYVT